MNEDEISADMSNSLRIAVDDIMVVERTKLNPKISHKKKSPPHADYINMIKLASKGYKERTETQLNEQDRKAIQMLTDKKGKKKGWALLCC